MTKYEYHIQLISYDEEKDMTVDEKALNYWGAEGWELVTVLGPTNTLEYGVALTHYFRRKIEPAR